MTDASPRSLNCPNCGAPLDFSTGQSTVRCRFCDSTIERSVADLTDDDDAHIIQIDSTGQVSGSAAGPARRFVLKMRNGEPVVIEVGQPQPRAVRQPPAPRPAPTTEELYNASRRAAARRAAQARASAAPARSSPWGCLITVAIVAGVTALIGGIIFASNPQSGLIVQQLLAGNFEDAFATGETFGANIILQGAAVILPGEEDAADQAVVLSAQYLGSDRPTQYRLLAFDLSEARLLWQSPHLGADLYRTPLLYDADRLYLLDEDNLIAVRRSDGGLAWTTTLADVVSLNICRDCLQLADGRLIALSDDGTIEAYAADTGESLWSDVSEQSSPRGLYVLGNKVAFMDRDEAADGYLRAYDPSSGDLTRVQPTCGAAEHESHADWTTPLHLAPDGESFYMLYGYGPSCFERWDADTLTVDWSGPLPENFNSSLDYVTLVAGADYLYTAGSSQVVAVSVTSGAARTLLEDEDYQFTVEAAYGDHLLLRAERTRGSRRYELWDVDPAGGDVRWTAVFEAAEPFALSEIVSEGTPAWLAQPTDAGVQLLWFEAAPDDESHAILTETLDWATGASGGKTRTELGLPTIIFETPSWLARRGDLLWMVAEGQLVAFDTATNIIVHRWP